MSPQTERGKSGAWYKNVRGQARFRTADYAELVSRAAEKRTRLRSRTRDLAERRPSLVRLLIALFVARLVVTVVELTESRLTWWALLITAAIGLEAWRAWSVSRVATAEHLKAAPLPDSRWARFLRPLERSGPAVLYSLTAIFAAATVVLVILGSSHDTLLDVAIIGREITTLFFLAVMTAAYFSVRNTER